MVFTMSEVTTGERLLTPGTGQEINHSPNPPIHITPGLQLAFQLQQVIISVKVLVPRVTESQIPSLLYRQSA